MNIAGSPRKAKDERPDKSSLYCINNQIKLTLCQFFKSICNAVKMMFGWKKAFSPRSPQRTLRLTGRLPALPGLGVPGHSPPLQMRPLSLLGSVLDAFHRWRFHQEDSPLLLDSSYTVRGLSIGAKRRRCSLPVSVTSANRIKKNNGFS
ncbi:hypothetical protein FKM82_029145 [Ascaphus truei]